MVDEKVLAAFQMMWGPFPGPVRLIDRERTIVAVNARAAEKGDAVGAKCYAHGAATGGQVCAHCQSDRALAEGHTVTLERLRNGRRVIGYWMPLAAPEGLFVHFGFSLVENAAPDAPPVPSASSPASHS